MTRIPDVKYHQVGNFYGLRNWVEYGLKQSKNELGWADFRLISYTDIEKWWEIICSAYLLVNLHSKTLPTLKKPLAGISNTGLGILLAEHHHARLQDGLEKLAEQPTFNCTTFCGFSVDAILAQSLSYS